jgi:Putative Na+/H+ antiporter
VTSVNKREASHNLTTIRARSLSNRYAQPSPRRRAKAALTALLIAASVLLCSSGCAAGSISSAEPLAFPKPLAEYHDQHIPGLVERLLYRVAVEPFNLVGTLIFACAIVHTFLTSVFSKISHRYEEKFNALEPQENHPESRKAVARLRDKLQFRVQLFRFMGEVEVVFGIWLIPLFLSIVLMKGWPTLVSYSASINSTEPIFVVAIMAMASSRPVLRVAERVLASLAGLGGYGPAAWWLTILTVGPALGSFITEPGAMTICALLLRNRLYKLGLSLELRYATLGLLFVGVSVGGTLSHFAAPPVVMVAGAWKWDSLHMLINFGWKATLGTSLSSLLYFWRFRQELFALTPTLHGEVNDSRPIPKRIIVTHLLFLGWTVATARYPTLVILGFLFFLGFVQATGRHQEGGSVRGPLLVGFFLISLVFHGTCQQWWLEPILGRLSQWPLMIGATILTGFNDNAAITYLASLVPNFSEHLKYAVMAGAVTGGGLTVIANAPNPVGQSILAPEFGENGVAPLGLLRAALIPTVIVGACFMLFR